MTTTSSPAARAAATSSTAVIAQSTVTSRSVPRAASRSTVEAARPYPSSIRLGRYQSTSAPSVRSARTRIAVAVDAVDVVVAVDRDPRAAGDVAEDHARPRLQAAERVERMRVGGGQERPRGGGVAEPAADEHLREHVRDAEVGGQPLGGGVVVWRDGESRVHRRQGRRSVRPR